MERSLDARALCLARNARRHKVLEDESLAFGIGIRIALFKYFAELRKIDFNKALRRYGRESRARALDPHPAVRLCGGVSAAGEDEGRVGAVKIRKADKFIYKHEYYPFLQKFRGTAVRTPAIYYDFISFHAAL